MNGMSRWYWRFGLAPGVASRVRPEALGGLIDKTRTGRKSYPLHPSLLHSEALEAALCHGWIDGQLKKGDAASWTQKFTPRRPKSIWSKRNRELVEELASKKKMKPAGLRAVEAAKADGRWDQAYDSPGKMNVPADFLRALSENPKAATVFAGLNKANIYAITWRLQTARKPATRNNRMSAIIAMLAEGKTFH